MPTTPTNVSRPFDDDHSAEPVDWRWSLFFTTWGLSVLFHTVLILALGLAWEATPEKPAGNAPELVRTIELVVRVETPEGPKYSKVKSSSQTNDGADATSGKPGAIDPRQLLGTAGGQSPVDIRSALPKAGPTAGLGGGNGAPMLGGGGLLDGPVGKSAPTGGKARTQVYGLRGEGFKFVYVFDRSASMSDAGKLESAKKQLLLSIADLGETHQFQIIFYNDTPQIMQLDGGRLVFGTEENKRRAREFVAAIASDGGTQHEPAITLALQLLPDVVFYLTDGDQPALSQAQLERIAGRNRSGAVINVIQFGDLPQHVGERSTNFLDQLATQNDGRKQYVDIRSAP